MTSPLSPEDVEAVARCPVCGHGPKFMPSMIRDAESVGCNWEAHCPEGGSFDFCTPYLPMDEAIRQWNEAVLAFLARQEGRG